LLSLSVDEYKKIANERRPDVVKASAERTFSLAKADYVNLYASSTTYPGRIAQNDLEKDTLLLQIAQRKATQEIAANYEKVNQAKQALEKSSESQKSAAQRYHETYRDYLNENASAAELADQAEKWLDSIADRIDSAYQYNVAVATLQYSAGF